MREGRIEQVGAYQTLFRYPLNTFVAGFLGLPPMNLLSGHLAEGGVLQLGNAVSERSGPHCRTNARG